MTLATPSGPVAPRPAVVKHTPTRAPDPSAPLDARALMARGYSKDEAYALLRRHGVKVPGGRRKRIAVTVLERIERGELAP